MPKSSPAADEPAPPVEDIEAAQPAKPRGNATSNESPALPANLVSGAARAHAALSQVSSVSGNGELSEGDRIAGIVRLVSFALDELDRYLPADVRRPAAEEVGRQL